MVRPPGARHVFFFAAAALVLAAGVAADPETVEGMYLEKRGDEAALKRLKERPRADGDRVAPQQARPSVPAFRQGHVGSGGAARAFQGVLGKESMPMGTVPSWMQQLQQRQRQLQQQRGPYPSPVGWRHESLTYSPPLGTSLKERGLETASSTASPGIISQATAAAASPHDLNQLNPQSTSRDDVIRTLSTANAEDAKEGEAATEAAFREKKFGGEPPRADFVKGAGEAFSDGAGGGGSSRHKAVLGVVLGVVFVVVFVAMGIGLAAQAVSDKVNFELDFIAK